MKSNPGQLKAALRESVRAEVGRITPERRSALAVQARALLEKQSAWREASVILFYAPMPGELDVWPMLEQALASGKTAVLPRFDAESAAYVGCSVTDPTKDVAPGKFGIREPTASCAKVSLNRLDFILVPGVAFDLHGRRLGRGSGFYDQLLAGVRGRTCGVGFDEQIVGEVPIEPHDIRLRCILTPTRWIEP